MSSGYARNFLLPRKLAEVATPAKVAEVERRERLGGVARPRSVEFKTMVADEIARTVWPYVVGGKLRPVIDSVFPLTQAAEAHARMEAGEHVGKIVLEIPQ